MRIHYIPPCKIVWESLFSWPKRLDHEWVYITDKIKVHGQTSQNLGYPPFYIKEKICKHCGARDIKIVG